MAELEHYGILGMKWGVRKDKKASGSSAKTEKQQLAEYKKSEMADVKARSDTYERKIAAKNVKLKTSGRTRSTRSQSKINAKRERFASEMRAVKNMKVSDMKTEKAYRGYNKIKNATWAAVSVASLVTPSPYKVFGIYTTSKSAITKTRLQRDAQAQVEAEMKKRK